MPYSDKYDFLRWKLTENQNKYPNTKFFLVRIFPHSNWIRRDTSYLSVFSPNTGKYGPEKNPYLNTFHTVHTFLTSTTCCVRLALRGKCPYLEFCRSVFSRIRTGNGEMRISLFSVRMRENTDQKYSEYRHFLCSVVYPFVLQLCENVANTPKIKPNVKNCGYLWSMQ